MIIIFFFNVITFVYILIIDFNFYLQTIISKKENEVVYKFKLFKHIGNKE